MERRIAVTIDDALKTVVDYYSREIGRVPDADKQAFFTGALKNGLTFDSLWAAIDYAVSVAGLGAAERDYWPHIQKEARRIWREMKKEKAAP